MFIYVDIDRSWMGIYILNHFFGWRFNINYNCFLTIKNVLKITDHTGCVACHSYSWVKVALKIVWELLFPLYHGKKVLASGGSSFICNSCLHLKSLCVMCVFLMEDRTVLCHLDNPLPDNWKQNLFITLRV